MANEAHKKLGDVGGDDKPRLQLIQSIPSRVTDGRDELNFAEFPLSAISERVDPNLKTLVFEDRIFDKSRQEHIVRKLTITSSDAYGLPTPLDEEVLLALIQLSRIQNFSSKRVYFTRHQLMQLLKWAPTGGNYARLEQALNRWMGVTMYYKNAWRDKAESKWLDESFHMLERVRIVDSSKRGRGEKDFEPSYFEWNDVVYKSFCKGNVKALDYEFFLSLGSSVAKRLYRFLDKRFYHSKEISFDLKILCYEHVGLSRKSPTGELKRAINGAIDELEARGYLERVPRESRFIKICPGEWKVVFRKSVLTPETSKDSAVCEEPKTLAQRLVEFGVSKNRVSSVCERYPQELIEEKLKIAIWMKERGDSRVSLNAPGFLIRSIEEAYTEPKEYAEHVKQSETRETERANETKRRRNAEEKREREEAKELAKRRAIDAYLASLDDAARGAIELSAISSADTSKAMLLSLGGKTAAAVKQSLIDAYVLEILANG